MWRLKLKRIIKSLFIAYLIGYPSYATLLMMFNSVDQYIKYAKRIWIVEVIKKTRYEFKKGTIYEVKVLQTLKGKFGEENLSICAVTKELKSGSRYLVFGFNQQKSGVFLDNGNISPVPIPASFSLNSLKGKSLKEQISCIITARHKELEKLINKMNEEKKALKHGIESEKQ